MPTFILCRLHASQAAGTGLRRRGTPAEPRESVAIGRAAGLGSKGRSCRLVSGTLDMSAAKGVRHSGKAGIRMRRQRCINGTELSHQYGAVHFKQILIENEQVRPEMDQVGDDS